MLGRLVRSLPIGDFLYEPKWDGFRCIAFRDADRVELRSRHDRPLGRYFPELVAALLELGCERFVLDGEIVGEDFSAVMARLHPAASRVERLSAETPATLIAFDVLAVADSDLRDEPFAARRSAVEDVVGSPAERVQVTPVTRSVETASAWLQGLRGIDGVMAKHRGLAYREGERAMLKVKPEHTLECVVAGFRLLADRPLPSSLLLGLFDEAGSLAHVGIAGAFSERLRVRLLEELEPLVVPIEGHPWERGFLLEGSPVGRLKGAAARWSPEEMSLDWIPIAPTRVAEVSYDHLDARRLRHPARFRRWRPDREPRSCTFAQV
jgi:ATP-dependent DNA ligase